MGWRSNSENQSLKTKTDLRERILEQAALPELRVLDLCAGSGDVWRNIGRRRPLAQYLPVDMKPQMPGTIKAKVNARFIAGFDIGRFNVVDVDTFGEPWEIWLALAPKLRGRTAVFLTHGYMTVGRCSLSNVARQAVGIPAEWPVPMKQELAQYVGEWCLHHGATVAGARQMERVRLEQKVTYYGMVCESPMKSGA